MVLRESLGWFRLPVGILSPAFMVFAALPPHFPAPSNLEQKISLEFPPSPNRGAPRSTAGGGVRGDEVSCTEPGVAPLTPLIPKEKIGVTTVPNPTIFVYVPKTTAQSAEFLIVNNKGKEVYEAEIKLPDRAGVMQIPLPETVALEVGTDYLWQFSILCDPKDREKDEFVQGWLQRTELSNNLKAQLDGATPLDRAKLYASERIWHETLVTVAQLSASDRQEWEELLKSVGLGAIASEPLLD